MKPPPRRALIGRMGDDVNSHLPPVDHDGTAIDWDTECLRTPLDFDAGEWAFLGVGALLWAFAIIGVVGAFEGWWLP